jgi:hypothetical protein
MNQAADIIYESIGIQEVKEIYELREVIELSLLL